MYIGRALYKFDRKICDYVNTMRFLCVHCVFLMDDMIMLFCMLHFQNKDIKDKERVYVYTREIRDVHLGLTLC